MKIAILCFCILIAGLCYSQAPENAMPALRIDKDYYQGIKNMQELSAGFVESFHLKDSVRSVTTYFPIVEEKNNRLLFSNEINIKYYPFIEFDGSGRLIALINTAPNYGMLRDTTAIEALKANTYKKDSLVWRIDRFFLCVG